MTLIRIRDLGYGVGGVRILDAVSLEVPQACWFGLVGANGSGKTTLLRCLAGRLPVVRGAICLGGQDCSQDPAARAGFFGVAPDVNRLPLDLQASELIEVVSIARGGERPILRDLHDLLEIGRLWSMPLRRMSSGMRQRIAIYLAFLGQPQAVILDEPFNWLDPVAAYEFKQMMRLWTKDGGTLISAIHDIASFAEYCSQGIVLSGGAVVRAYDFENKDSDCDVRALEREVYELLGGTQGWEGSSKNRIMPEAVRA